MHVTNIIVLYWRFICDTGIKITSQSSLDVVSNTVSYEVAKGQRINVHLFKVLLINILVRKEQICIHDIKYFSVRRRALHKNILLQHGAFHQHC